MGNINDHGQLRWDEKQGVQYIVAWDVDGNQSNLSGAINYQINNRNGYVAPKVELVSRQGGITIINDAGDGTATLTIEPNSTPKVDDTTKVDMNGPYYVALTQGYLAGNRMDDGDYIVVDAYITALVPPIDNKDSVTESEGFHEEFELVIQLKEPTAYRNLEVCYYDTSTDDKLADTWKPAKDIGATVSVSIENQSVTIRTTKLGQYVVTSITPPSKSSATPQYAPAAHALSTIVEAGLTVEAAGKAMQASAKTASGLSGNLANGPYPSA